MSVNSDGCEEEVQCHQEKKTSAAAHTHTFRVTFLSFTRIHPPLALSGGASPLGYLAVAYCLMRRVNGFERERRKRVRERDRERAMRSGRCVCVCGVEIS